MFLFVRFSSSVATKQKSRFIIYCIPHISLCIPSQSDFTCSLKAAGNVGRGMMESRSPMRFAWSKMRSIEPESAVLRKGECTLNTNVSNVCHIM